MIEILQYKEINKGSLTHKINVKIIKWGLIINNITVFNKNGARWISLPQEKYESNGEKKYISIVHFCDSDILKRFQESVLKELDNKINGCNL